MAKGAVNLVGAVGGLAVATGGGFVLYDTITNGEVDIPSWVWYVTGGILLLVGVGLVTGHVSSPKIS
jgi:hypothetical protein